MPGRSATATPESAPPSLIVYPGNIALMPLPPRNHKINPAENLRANMRKTQLANRGFRTIDDITDACCDAWNAIPYAPGRIKSIGSFP